MLSSFINAAICSQPTSMSAVVFVLAHRLLDVNKEDEMTTMFTMFTMFQDSLTGVCNSTLANLLGVCTPVSLGALPCPPSTSLHSPSILCHSTLRSSLAP
jgi:hypothetical protein